MEFIKQINKQVYAIKISAEENGQVLGWTMLYIIRNERHDEPYGFLENLYVEQEHRRSGIGKRLIQEAINEAKAQGCYKIIGTSRTSKEEVHNFYLKYGFVKWGYEFRMDLKESKPKQKD